MSQVGFRFTPFTNSSVTASWSAKGKDNKDMQSRSRSVSGPEIYGRRTEEEEERQRAIDSETDANTEYNAAKLSANMRPRSNSAGERKKKKSTSKEEKARRRAVADEARRERRRNAGLDSDTTQGEDSDSDQYRPKPRPMHGMFTGQTASTSKRGTFNPLACLADLQLIWPRVVIAIPNHLPTRLTALSAHDHITPI
jgi:hypothetical protein